MTTIPTQASVRSLDALLHQALDKGASDVHLAAGAPPMMRLDGIMTPMDGESKLLPAQIELLVREILTSDQLKRLGDELEFDGAIGLGGRGRWRINVYHQRGSVGMALRSIPNEIKPLSDLGVPAAIGQLANAPRGLVLVTGPTGSGKSTTLAGMVDQINTTRRGHIMTVEDPIEFVHSHKQSLVNQREVGTDTHAFANALKRALRQDPDVILVGEMRDLETIGTALTAAETGHLVLGTLHTQSAAQTIDRIIDVFPAGQQAQVRVQLASSLQGIVCQQLLPRIGGGRVAAVEVLVATDAVSNLIREGKTHQITSNMQTGAKNGMTTLDQSLALLVSGGFVELTDALKVAQNPDAFNVMLRRR